MGEIWLLGIQNSQNSPSTGKFPLETKIPSGDENCGDENSVYFLGDEYSAGDEDSENVGDESSEKSWRRNFQRRKFRKPSREGNYSSFEIGTCSRVFGGVELFFQFIPGMGN